MKFDVFTAVNIQIVAFWVMRRCSLVGGYQGSEGTYRIHLQYPVIHLYAKNIMQLIVLLIIDGHYYCYRHAVCYHILLDFDFPLQTLRSAFEGPAPYASTVLLRLQSKGKPTILMSKPG
jgi:hypothetical protein